jgi:hypothetical protein
MSDETVAEQVKAQQDTRDAEAATERARLEREKANEKPSEKPNRPFFAGPQAGPEPEPEPDNATTRLRAFEDKHIGADAVRLHGRVERGSGSRFQNPQVMTPELRRQHAALEKLVESEQHLADAHAKLLQAEADHQEAIAATEPRPDLDESGKPRRGPTVQEYVAAGNLAKNYPPSGYASRSTPEEIDAAIKAQGDGGK